MFSLLLISGCAAQVGDPAWEELVLACPPTPGEPVVVPRLCLRAPDLGFRELPPEAPTDRCYVPAVPPIDPALLGPYGEPEPDPVVRQLCRDLVLP